MSTIIMFANEVLCCGISILSSFYIEDDICYAKNGRNVTMDRSIYANALWYEMPTLFDFSCTVILIMYMSY